MDGYLSSSAHTSTFLLGFTQLCYPPTEGLHCDWFLTWLWHRPLCCSARYRYPMRKTVSPCLPRLRVVLLVRGFASAPCSCGSVAPHGLILGCYLCGYIALPFLVPSGTARPSWACFLLFVVVLLWSCLVPVLLFLSSCCRLAVGARAAMAIRCTERGHKCLPCCLFV